MQKNDPLWKSYPLPIFALSGLLVGLFVYFILHQHEWASWIWLGTLVLGGTPIVFNTIKGMFHGKFASDIVAMLAIITAVILEQYLAGAVVVLMQSGGEAIEKYGFKQATSSLKELLERAPKRARRKHDGQMEEIDVDEVKIGDILIVRPGDLVPVDATIVEGEAEIDESAITGEPLPRTRSVGEHLLSGSVNVNGVIELKAEKLSKESQYAKIVELVKKAQEEKSPLVRLADRFAIYFTPLTLLMAAIGYLVTRDTTTILSVLVVATPCPLILATPLAFMCGINKAAKAGIIVKGGPPLEFVAYPKAVLFDKTGTITFGTPFVEEVVSYSDTTPDQLLFVTASVEQFSSHSIAKAIIKKAKEKFPTLPLPENFKELKGFGVEGEVNKEHFLIGSLSYLNQKKGKGFYTSNGKESRYYDQHKMVIYVVKEDKVIGFLVLSDQIRPNVPAMIQKLRDLGVEEIRMLSGDSIKNTEGIAKLAGIHEFNGEVLPEEKAAIIQKIKQTKSPLIMVGDGINDAPALATATVGIAMGAHGTAISAEAATMVLLKDDVTQVVEAITIGRRALVIAKESIWIGIGLSFVLMVFAVFGHIQPVVGAMLQEIIDVAVILNALRAR